FNVFFFFSSRRRHTRSKRDWSSDVCSSDLRWLKWLLWIGGIVIAIGGIALIALTMYLNKSKPKIDGETIVQVLDEEVIVTRDQRSEERRVGKECRCRTGMETRTRISANRRG